LHESFWAVRQLRRKRDVRFDKSALANLGLLWVLVREFAIVRDSASAFHYPPDAECHDDDHHNNDRDREKVAIVPKPPLEERGPAPARVTEARSCPPTGFRGGVLDEAVIVATPFLQG